MKKKIFVWIILLGFLASCSLLLTPSTATVNAPPATRTPEPTATSQPCLASGDQNDINARLRLSGDVAVLCQGAVFELTGSVLISADNQQIYTEGFPIDEGVQCYASFQLK